MTKRFTDNETKCLSDSSFTDNLTKKIYVVDEWERIIGLCNNLWNQTQRFEKHNQELVEENEQLKTEYKVLHTQYQDLKKFVENNFDEYLTQEKLNRQISELSDENEQLKKVNKQLLCTIVEILDFIEDKREVSVEEMGRWWKEKETELQE